MAPCHIHGVKHPGHAPVVRNAAGARSAVSTRCGRSCRRVFCSASCSASAQLVSCFARCSAGRCCSPRRSPAALLFERVLVSPLWNFAMRFASKPALTLESAVTDEATAVTSFDANGQGIVSLEVDGQVVQILATLRPDDRVARDAASAPGSACASRTWMPTKNRCTVSHLVLTVAESLSFRSRCMSSMFSGGVLIALVVGFVVIVVPMIVASFLRNVEAGTIRLVSWLAGGTVIYRGPGKSKEIPLLTTGTTISSKVINIDLDITDQTADIDENGTPRPIKVRVLASAIVSVGDTDALIKTAANRFFSKSDADQLSTLTDLLSSSGRRAMNLLTHDQLFSAKAAPARRARSAGGSVGGDAAGTRAPTATALVAERSRQRSRTKTIRSP